ncbi:MAG: preprotein translocase subunit SecE [Armatimonadetes bacterium]|nr:preprotein translocase subunit SecE [Armatimonadota bacterium]
MSKAVESRAAVQAFKKPGLFLKEVGLELKKVKWPTWADVRQLTAVVLMTLVGVGVYVALLELVISKLFALIGIFK